MADKLFVYGTLHPDRAPSEIAHIVRGFRRFGSGSIRARLHNFRDYPAIKLVPGARRRVNGEVYIIDDPQSWQPLDEYEEYYPATPEASLFKRSRVKVKLESGGSVEAWVYEYARKLPFSGIKKTARAQGKAPARVAAA